MLITLREYAKKWGVTYHAISKRAHEGRLPGAEKHGWIYLIDENQPLVDNRVKSGRYVGWRKKTTTTETKKEEEHEISG